MLRSNLSKSATGTGPLGLRSRPNRLGPNEIRKLVAEETATTPVPRIVAIGGGTGLPVVLKGLADLVGCQAANDHLTAIVTVTDNGGSSGVMRREFGILPPGDIRNCLVALAEPNSPVADLLQHRFPVESSVNGHPIGNLVLAALAQMSGDFGTAIEQLSRLLRIRGRVLPATRENVTLKAEFETGEIVLGETEIVAHHKRIKRLSLTPDVRPVPETIEALVNADAVVVGPGSLYTSILPNLLIGGVASTMSGVNAVRIYVANLMTQPGETDGFTLEDHLQVIRQHVGFDLFDYILVNDRAVDAAAVARYAMRGAAPVHRKRARSRVGQAQIVRRSLSWSLEGGKIRHSPCDLAKTIVDLLQQGRPVPERFLPNSSRPETSTRGLISLEK